MAYAAFRSIGAYIPPKIMTNADFEKIIDTSDEWITKRTGIKERRISEENEASSDLGAKAAEQAIERAGIAKEDIDLVICATTSYKRSYLLKKLLLKFKFSKILIEKLAFQNLNDFKKILIVGSGTGNDVATALRSTNADIDAIEIDDNDEGTVRIVYEEEEKYHVFKVYDTGAAIENKAALFEAFKSTIDLSTYAVGGIKGLLLFTLIGIFATVVMQSSHATLVLIITALSAGQISYENALALAIGANVGTTITAILGAMSSNIEGKRLAGAHLIFNVVTGLIAIIFIYQIIYLAVSFIGEFLTFLTRILPLIPPF